MKRTLVALTGASGGIGRALLEELIQRYEVKALFRKQDALTEEWRARGCTIVIGDLLQSASLRELAAGTEILFHCAAKVTGFKAEEFLAANVEGTQRLAAAAAAEGCRRFVHISSAAVYAGANPSAQWAEDLALEESRLKDPYSLSKLRAEKTLAATLGGSATEYTIARPTFVYGPRMNAWTLLPLESLRKKRPFYIGLDGGDGLLDAVYVNDVVQGILLMAEHSNAPGETFNLGHETVMFREFYEYLGQMAGVVPRFATEKSLRRIHSIASAASRFSKGIPRAIANGIESLLQMSLNDAGYSSRKARELLGYAPRFSLSTGMFETELWLREQGLLPPKRGPFWNADRHYAIETAAIPWPANESELVQAVRHAAERGLKFRAIGALHSFAPLPQTSGACVSLARMNRVLKMEESTVTAEAGITLAELNKVLTENERALPTLGTNTAQTLAGAISTGTHGGSIHHGSLSDYVESIRLITSAGTVLELRRDDPRFGGAVVSLGLLGVISSVTIKCEPLFHLRSTTKIMPLDSVLENFERIQRANDYVDLSYYPQTNEVAMLLINRAEPPKTESALAGRQRLSAFQQRFLSRSFKMLLKGLPRLPGALRKKTMQRFMQEGYRPRHGRSDEVLNFVELLDCEPFPIDDLEFAVPFAAAKSVVKELVARFGTGADYGRFFPIHIRCSKAGDQWLAANYGQDVAWFEFWQYPPEPAFYAALHEIFRPFQYRMHWGKLAGAPLRSLAHHFPRLPEFIKLRRELDPSGMFLNPYLQEAFA